MSKANKPYKLHEDKIIKAFLNEIPQKTASFIKEQQLPKVQVIQRLKNPKSTHFESNMYSKKWLRTIPINGQRIQSMPVEQVVANFKSTNYKSDGVTAQITFVKGHIFSIDVKSKYSTCIKNLDEIQSWKTSLKWDFYTNSTKDNT